MSTSLEMIGNVTANATSRGEIPWIRFRTALWGLVASIPVFVLCATSGLSFYRHKAFNQEDVVFMADPYYRSYAFAHGYGERSLVHPNLSNFVNPWVRFLAWPLTPLLPGLEPSELRMRLALYVSPLFAALTSYLIFLSAMAARVDFVKALALSFLFGFSISTIAYGSVPDHFLISSFVLTGSVLLFQLDAGLDQRFRLGAWISIVTLAGSITITNIFPLLALFFLARTRLGSTWVAGARQALWVFFSSAVLILVSWAALNFVYGDFSSLQQGHAYDKNFGRIAAHLTDNPARDFISFPFTFGQAFWGGRPDIEKIPQYPKPEIASYDVSILYNPPLAKPSLYGAALLVPILIVGLSLCLGLKFRRADSLAFVSAGIIFASFSWLLHTFWGGVELFLFSQHWHFASVLALIPLALVWQSRVSIYAFVGVPVIIALANLAVWRGVLAILPTLALR